MVIVLIGIGTMFIMASCLKICCAIFCMSLYMNVMYYIVLFRSLFFYFSLPIFSQEIIILDNFSTFISSLDKVANTQVRG